MYYLFLIQFLLAILSLFLFWQAIGYFRKIRLLKKIQKTPLPDTYRKILEKLPHYRALPEDLKRKLHRSILYFISTKEFIPVQLTLTEEMKVTIAFYACLMHLNLQEECYETLHTIIIYPNDLITQQTRSNGGIFTKKEFLLEGQSAGGTVVIAWNEAKREALHPGRHNVIIHELAHELDFEEGDIDGIPPLSYTRYHEWAKVMFKTYERLKERMAKGRYPGKYTLLGSYAATNEAEFFAVVSELFFEKPHTLQKHFPEIYKELEDFYGLDTATLFGRLN